MYVYYVYVYVNDKISKFEQIGHGIGRAVTLVMCLLRHSWDCLGPPGTVGLSIWT